MGKLTMPHSDYDRLKLLRRAAAQMNADTEQGTDQLPAQTRELLTDLLARFATSHEALKAAKGTRRDTGTEVAAAAQVEALVRQVWDTATWQVRWRGLQPGVLGYFGLTTSGRRVRHPKTPTDWLEAGYSLLAGQTRASEDGHPLLVDQETLQMAMTGLEQALLAHNEARQQLVTVREGHQELRGQVNRLIRRLGRDLRYALHDSPARQEATLRAYGFQFERNSAPEQPETDGTRDLQGWQVQAEDEQEPAAEEVTQPAASATD